jgi:hypothetical protein
MSVFLGEGSTEWPLAVQSRRLKGWSPGSRTSMYPYVASRGPTYRENSHASHTWYPSSRQTVVGRKLSDGIALIDDRASSLVLRELQVRISKKVERVIPSSVYRRVDDWAHGGRVRLAAASDARSA